MVSCWLAWLLGRHRGSLTALRCIQCAKLGKLARALVKWCGVAIRLLRAFTLTDQSLHLKAVDMQQHFKLNCTGNELIVVPGQ